MVKPKPDKMKKSNKTGRTDRVTHLRRMFEKNKIRLFREMNSMTQSHLIEMNMAIKQAISELKKENPNQGLVKIARIKLSQNIRRMERVKKIKNHLSKIASEPTFSGHINPKAIESLNTIKKGSSKLKSFFEILREHIEIYERKSVILSQMDATFRGGQKLAESVNQKRGGNRREFLTAAKRLKNNFQRQIEQQDALLQNCRSHVENIKIMQQSGLMPEEEATSYIKGIKEIGIEARRMRAEAEIVLDRIEEWLKPE